MKGSSVPVGSEARAIKSESRMSFSRGLCASGFEASRVEIRATDNNV